MRNNSVYIDSETCGLAGMMVLLQYAYEDGEIVLHEVWKEPIHKTLDLIESFTDKSVVMFNAAFDWFHLCKIYTTFRLLDYKELPVNIPVHQVAVAEKSGRDGPCLKPKGIMDLMLHSRKGIHQTLMSRHDIRVRKIPIELTELVRSSLAETIELDPILNAKWVVADRKNHKGVVSEEFKDVVLRFRADKGLKSLAKHCLNLDPKFNSFKEIWPDRECLYAEYKYAPFAMACGNDEWKVRNAKGKLKGYCWPRHIHNDIRHWSTNEEARQYAKDDVKYTRMLDEYYGFPEENDDDSVLACMVAAVRWHGFQIDSDKTAELLAKSSKMLETSPININRPVEVRDYIKEVMDPTEGLLLDKSTKKANLERIKDRMVVLAPDEGDEDEMCISCYGEGCKRCKGLGVLKPGPMECSIRADQILKIKAASKEHEQHRKLLLADRFHASFKVIGTLSSRMAGGDGLNAQGIKKSEEVRQAFTLAWPGMMLCGGDFDSFEVTIAEAVYKDKQVTEDLKNGLSIHTVMAQQLYPGKTFEEIAASKGLKDGGLVDMYTRGKSAVFTVIYGGNAGTIARKLAIKESIADEVFEGFQDRYQGIRKERELNNSKFSSMTQPGGPGTKILWTEPADYCETFLGFRRYFTLENRICKALFQLANKMPKEWQIGDFENGSFVPKTCVRRDKAQSLSGAASSAIYGAAFSLQGANTRAASNHLIQSPGAMMTKRLECAIWEVQPVGVNEWHVAPMNVHDEVLVVVRPELADSLVPIVRHEVESFRKKVPLIGIKWITGMTSWGEQVKNDDPRMTLMTYSKELDDGNDPDANLPTLDESFEEWVEREDDDD